jgi:O-antigen/teichoic acid export membrane protein
LTTHDYGVIAAVYSYIALLNILYQYGMDQAYLRFASEKNIDKKDVFSTPFFAVSAISVIFSVLILSNGNSILQILRLPRESYYIIFYGVIILMLDSVILIPFSKLRLEHKAWKFAGIRTVSVFVNIVLNIILVGFMKMSIKGILLSGMFASLSALILFLPDILKSLKFKFEKKLFLQMFKFAWPFVPAGFGSITVMVIDKPLLMFMAGPSVAGIYQANYKFGIFMLLVVAMFDQAWKPFFLSHAKDENAKEIFAKVLTYFAVLSVWLIFAVSLFIGDFIKISFFGYHILHPDYWGGTGIIPIVLTGYLFYGLYINFIAAPVLSKKTQILIGVTLIGAAINISANLVLIKFFGMFGAAWASFASYAVMAFALFVFSKHLYRIPYEWKRILHLTVLSLAMIAVYYFAKYAFSANFKIFLAVKAGILITFPFLLFITGFFTEQEINAVKRRVFKTADL